MGKKTINWPSKYDPKNSAVHVVNSLGMDVTPQAAWEQLIRAVEWPNWYENAKNVRLLDGADTTDLELGMRFRWKTFGMTITCTVEEFIPYERLAWSSESFGMSVYHAWLFIARPDGCHVITEETQNGFIPKLAARLMPDNMHKFHQIWLEGLKARTLATAP